VYVPLHVAAHMPGYEGLPEAAFEARTAYAAAAAVIPPNAIVQSNLLDTDDYANVANMLYPERAMVTDAEEDCGAVFGGDPSICSRTQQEVRSLFVLPAPAASEARARCREWGASYLSVAKTDPAWQDASGWVWTLPLATERSGTTPPVAGEAGASFRVVNCGSSVTSVP